MNKLKKIWHDPVGSKVIANLLWILIAAIAMGGYIFFNKIANDLSLIEAWNSFYVFLSEVKVITNGQFILIIIVMGLIIINKKPLRIMIVGFLKLIYDPNRYHDHGEYILSTNISGYSQLRSVNTERSMNSFTIKPLDNSVHWLLGIYYSHNYKNLSTEDLKDCPYILIYKKRNEDLLCLEEYDNCHVLIPNSKKILLKDYYDQEFILDFKYDYDQGGIELNIIRLNNKLYKSEIYFGYTDFLIKIWADNNDYKIKIVYDHYF